MMLGVRKLMINAESDDSNHLQDRYPDTRNLTPETYI
jgi:hypothetical protein